MEEILYQSFLYGFHCFGNLSVIIVPEFWSLKSWAILRHKLELINHSFRSLGHSTKCALGCKMAADSGKEDGRGGGHSA